jgi:hypothetical protein
MKKILFIFILTICYLLNKVPLAKAESLSFGISPSVITIQAKPNSTIRTQLQIENFSDNPVNLFASFQEFTASEKDNGQITFIPSSPAFTTLLSKITILQDNHVVQNFTLAPKQKQKLGIQINIPQSLPARDYTFSVIFATADTTVNDTNQESSATQIIGGIGTNILLSVGEVASSHAIIEEFSSPRFLQHGPVPFTVRIHNPGSHVITVSGTILVRNMFGQLIGKVKPQNIHILAEKSRSFSQDEDNIIKASESTIISNNELKPLSTVFWPETFLLGPYQATLELSVSESGSTYSRNIYFLALPYQAVLLFIAIIIIILFIKRRVDKYLST